MNVKVRFFASLKEQFGRDSVVGTRTASANEQYGLMGFYSGSNLR